MRGAARVAVARATAGIAGRAALGSLGPGGQPSLVRVVRTLPGGRTEVTSSGVAAAGGFADPFAPLPLLQTSHHHHSHTQAQQQPRSSNTSRLFPDGPAAATHQHAAAAVHPLLARALGSAAGGSGSGRRSGGSSALDVRRRSRPTTLRMATVGPNGELDEAGLIEAIEDSYDYPFGGGVQRRLGADSSSSAGAVYGAMPNEGRWTDDGLPLDRSPSNPGMGSLSALMEGVLLQQLETAPSATAAAACTAASSSSTTAAARAEAADAVEAMAAQLRQRSRDLDNMANIIAARQISGEAPAFGATPAAAAAAAEDAAAVAAAVADSATGDAAAVNTSSGSVSESEALLPLTSSLSLSPARGRNAAAAAAAAGGSSSSGEDSAGDSMVVDEPADSSSVEVHIARSQELLAQTGALEAEAAEAIAAASSATAAAAAAAAAAAGSSSADLAQQPAQAEDDSAMAVVEPEPAAAAVAESAAAEPAVATARSTTAAATEGTEEHKEGEESTDTAAATADTAAAGAASSEAEGGEQAGGSAEAEEPRLECPPGIDPEVFYSLPTFIQEVRDWHVTFHSSWRRVTCRCHSKSKSSALS
jgi:hypothetical protein